MRVNTALEVDRLVDLFFTKPKPWSFHSIVCGAVRYSMGYALGYTVTFDALTKPRSLPGRVLRALWKNKSKVAVATILSILASRYIAKKMLEAERLDASWDALGLKNKFQTAFNDMPQWWKKPVCSHPEAANDRSLMRVLMIEFALNLAPTTRVVMLDASPSDMRAEDMKKYGDRLICERLHYTGKDTRMVERKPELVLLDNNTIFMFVDSDYYHDDLPQYLASSPCMLYTFRPREIVGEVANGHYYPTSYDTIRTEIGGGATYEHKVWDFRRDTLHVPDGLYITEVLVESRECSENRWLVLTIPTARVSILHAYWTEQYYLFGILRAIYPTFTIFSGQLNRMDFALRSRKHEGRKANQIVHTMYHDKERGNMISLGLIGTDICIKLEFKVFYAVYLRWKRMGTKITLGSLSSVASSMTPIERKTFANVDLENLNYILMAIDDETYLPGITGKVDPQGRGITPHRQPQDVEYLDWYANDSKTYSQQLMEPILPKAHVIRINEIAARDCLSARLVEQRQSIPTDLDRLAEYEMLIEESLYKEFGEYKHNLVPLDLQDVKERMTKPSQQMTIAELEPYLNPGTAENRVFQAFLKKESTSKFGAAARNISQVSNEVKVAYSMYSIAMADTQKDKSWYAFGKAPAVISESVHVLNQKARDYDLYRYSTDCSKHDARHGTVMQMGERTRVKFFFADPDPALRFLKQIADSQGYLTDRKLEFKIKYKNRISRPSGEPTTAYFNSCNVRDLAYITIRKGGIITRSGKIIIPPNCTHEQAMEFMGLHGGDDGIMIGIDPKVLEEVATDFNCALKILAENPEDPLTFLARTYLNPVISGSSITDVARCLSKVHFTCRPIDDLKEMYARKAISLITTDSKTPIVREVAALYQRSADKTYLDKVVKKLKEGNCDDEYSYAARCTYLNGGEGYPQIFDEEDALDAVADALGIDVCDVLKIEEELRKCKHVKDFKMIPLNFPEQKTHRDAQVGDDFLPADTTVTLETTITKPSCDTLKLPLHQDAMIRGCLMDLIEKRGGVYTMDGDVVESTELSDWLVNGQYARWKVRELYNPPPGRLTYRPNRKNLAHHNGQLKLMYGAMVLYMQVKSQSYEFDRIISIGSGENNAGLWLANALDLPLITVDPIDPRQMKPGQVHLKGCLVFDGDGTKFTEVFKAGSTDLVLFDFRTAKSRNPTDAEIIEDTQLMNLIMQMFWRNTYWVKFRPPFQKDMKFINPDELHFQCFGPKHSTEMRALYYGKQLAYKDLITLNKDMRKDYEQRLSFHNNVVRSAETNARSYDEWCFEVLAERLGMKDYSLYRQCLAGADISILLKSVPTSTCLAQALLPSPRFQLVTTGKAPKGYAYVARQQQSASASTSTQWVPKAHSDNSSMKSVVTAKSRKTSKL